MIVAFPHVESTYSAEEALSQRQLALLMIESVRRTMPGFAIWMMTDAKTPELPGCNVIRKSRGNHKDWIPWLCEFYTELPDREALILDTDVIVQRNLSPLFRPDADVVLTSRGPKVVDGREMPFLFGVVASKSPEFWIEVRNRVMKMPEEADRMWWGSQVATFDMYLEEQAGRGKWDISLVSCDKFNYPPKSPDDMPTDKWALHYKGKKRKHWMLDRWAHLLDEKPISHTALDKMVAENPAMAAP